VGVSYRFGGAPAPAPAAAATTALPPAPIVRPAPEERAPAPEVPAKVIAFFDFDKANLRPDALQIVREAADYAKGHNVTVIHVTGYTDTMGSVDYNLALSKRRAETVKAELVRLGIPAKEIDVAWKGKSNLLVPTADQVREPQNRRVEIIYD
jgi:outer membrane protein OmpA-like peptidoglycan-associated protein